MLNKVILVPTVLIIIAVLLMTSDDAVRSQDRPWMNKSLTPGRRAELLVKEMTLDEKISQIHMVDKPERPRGS